MMVDLPQKWTDYLITLPETGMGYQKVWVELRDGRVIKDAVVLNAEHLIVEEEDESFKSRDIVDIGLENGARDKIKRTVYKLIDAGIAETRSLPTPGVYASSTYHVVPARGGWAVTRERAKRAADRFNRKQEAIDFGRKLALSKSDGAIVIHGRDGKIQGGGKLHTRNERIDGPRLRDERRS